MTRPTDERLRRIADGMRADRDEGQAMAAELLALRAEAEEREARLFPTQCEAEDDGHRCRRAPAWLWVPHDEPSASLFVCDECHDNAMCSPVEDRGYHVHISAFARLRAALASDAGSRWADDPRGTCPDCGHGWAYHASPSSGGPCGVAGCDCEGEGEGDERSVPAMRRASGDDDRASRADIRQRPVLCEVP